MKTLDEAIKTFKSECLDGRDAVRLSVFVPDDRLSEIGLVIKPESAGTRTLLEYTRDNVIAQLRDAVAFGFVKALDKRGISSSFMFATVTMWNKILEDGLEDWGYENYAEYGLPLFKATALKYGFDNPIGNDSGDEYKYSAEADE